MSLEDYSSEFSHCLHCHLCYVSDWIRLGEWLPICPSGTHFGFESFYSSGKIEIARAIVDKDISVPTDRLLNIVYSCIGCGACHQQCKNLTGFNANQVELFEDMKADFMKRGWGPLPDHNVLIKSLSNYDNPWVMPRSEKERWFKDLGVKDINEEGSDVLYFVGCTAAFDPKIKKTAISTVNLLKKANVDFGVLGKKEMCCGSISKRIGDVDAFEKYARQNIERFNELGVKTVITSCAGCYRTLKNEYPDVSEMNFDVLTSLEFINNLIKEGKIKPKEQTMNVTYHDPCHLGRHSELYDAPRNILRAIPGVKLKEMKQNKENAWCCGAGGGVRTAFYDFAVETAKTRIKQAEDTGAEALVTACPFCFQNLDIAIKESKSDLKMFDVIELVDKATL